MKCRLALFGLLFSIHFSATPRSDLDSLKAGLEFFQYKMVNINLIQYQYGESYYSDISISFMDTTTYLIRSSVQDIFVSGRIIKTWNKQSNQLIIDKRLDNERDVFSLLSGNIDGITILNRQNNNGYISVDFLLNDLEISGTLELTSHNWRLHQIKIDYDQDNWIKLVIDNWKILTEELSIDQFGIEAGEVIDLRE